MATLETQYKNYILKHPDKELTYIEWFKDFSNIYNLPPEISEWDNTLMDGLENEPPYISDDFQIGPDGAYEHNEIVHIQQQLIDLLYSQVIDLSMMSKIELGDDVIAEIKRLKQLINE
jgi:hypothetical protein